MPWPSDKIPALRPHSSGRAIATFNGNDRYFGKFGTPEAQAAYDAYVAEWLASGRRSHPTDPGRSKGPTINELIVGYLNFAEGYYVKDGKPTREVWAVKAFLQAAQGAVRADGGRQFRSAPAQGGAGTIPPGGPESQGSE